MVSSATKKQNKLYVRFLMVKLKVCVDLKVIAGSGEWRVLAGRLDPRTTTEELTDMLRANNIKVFSCKLLPKTEEWHQKYAAFHVLVDVADKTRKPSCR